MSCPPDNFDTLKKLLALKRHELPPPGFFSRLPDRIIARIEAEGLARQLPWWERWISSLEAKPVLAGAYGLLVGGLLVVGLSISRTAESEEAVATPQAGPWFAETPVPLPAHALGSPTEPSSSITPVVENRVRSPFEIPRMQSVTVGYTVP